MRAGLFAFSLASLFPCAAVYIKVVEQPARLALCRSMVREWLRSNRRAFVMLSPPRSSRQVWLTWIMLALEMCVGSSLGR
jgi:hypothetical protein